MSIDSNSSAKKFNLERATNFMRQFRDPDSRELKKLSANQFMEVWSHYDRDGNGYIEGTELDGFLKEFVSSANFTDISPDMKSNIKALVVLSALVLYVRGAAIENAIDTARAEAFERAAVISGDLISGIISPGDKLLYRGFRSKPSVLNVSQSETVRYIPNANITVRITYISALAVGSTTAANARISWGGFNENNVSIYLSSVKGFGYQYWIQIWGRERPVVPPACPRTVNTAIEESKDNVDVTILRI